MRIYLSGGLESDWRDKVKGEVPNIEFLSPKPLGIFQKQDEWWTYDKILMQMADAIFAYIEPGIWVPVGLLIEIGEMHGLGKPVILVNERYYNGIRKEGESPENQLTRYLECVKSFADVLFASLDDGIEYLKGWG